MVINWTDDAKEDLVSIISFIDERNSKAASELESQIFSTVEQLTQHPFLYRNGRIATTREIVIHPNYIIVYQVLTDSIKILNVLHARQQYP
jgi:toxin ParE1/3/4